MHEIKQSTAFSDKFFAHDAAGDAVTGMVDGGFTKRIAKGGGAFGAMTVTITEDENGWYDYTLSASHSDTLGKLSITFINASCKQVNLQYRVTARIKDDFAYPTTPGRSIDVEATGEVGLNYDNVVGTIDAADIGADAITEAKIADNAIAAEHIAADAIGASELATDAIGSAQLATSAVDEIVDQTWDELIAAHVGVGSFGEEVQAHAQPGDAMALTAGGVDDIWDEILTGATHNIADSSGRRIRDLQEFGVYENAAIWIDTVNGSPGTTDFESGTAFNPVNTMADANTLAASRGLSTFHIASGSSIAFIAAQNNQLFIGSNWTLALGGQSIVGTEIDGAEVSGIAAGIGSMQIFRNCVMGAVSHIKDTHLVECGIAGTQTMVEAGDFFMDRCHSAIAGTATWIFEFGAAIGNTNLNMRNYSGGVQLESMGDAGVDTASIEGQGQVIEGTCIGGTVAIRGNFTVSGIANLTLSDDARIDVDQIGDAAWDELIAGHLGAGSTGEALNNATAPTAADVADAVWDEDIVAAHGGADSSGLLLRALGAVISQRANNSTLDALLGVADVATRDIPEQVWAEATRDLTALGFQLDTADFVAAFLTAALIDTGAIDADALATDAGQELADRLLARSLATGADGGRTVQDALRVLRNRREDAAGTFTVYEEDDVTPAWTAATTRAAGNPITEIDPV